MFTARKLEDVDNGRGYWRYQRIGVFRGEEQVGEHVYTYSSGLPFAAFEQDGQWYALASRKYTCTEILRLPDCEWIGGETPAAGGFCPVELYVPSYRVQRWRWEPPEKVEGVRREIVNDPNGPNEFRYYDHEQDDSVADYPLRFAPYGFVSGCVWGDDSSWKLEMFDLSRVKDGILTRSRPWGYLELPEGFSLRDCIRLDSDVEGAQEYVTLHVAEMARFRFDNGTFRDFRQSIKVATA